MSLRRKSHDFRYKSVDVGQVFYVPFSTTARKKPALHRLNAQFLLARRDAVA